jgi:hypothetical protein
MYATKVTGMAKAKRQIDKFKEAARELETDDSEKHFNEELGKIASAETRRCVEARSGWPKSTHDR